MSLMNEHHHTAMDFAARALMERMRGNVEDERTLFSQALKYERLAIAELKGKVIQPTHSVLHRSAATLALDCGETRLAEQLAARGLAEDAPWEIAEELRDVMEQVNFSRHLAVKRVELGDDDIQMSLAGQAVGVGFIDSSEFLERIESIKTIIIRIIERKQGESYRTRGMPSKDITDNYPLLMSETRAGSYSVTLKLGQPDQMKFPGMSAATKYIDEFMDLMELINNVDISEIERQISDSAYFKNFMREVKKIAPDGNRVNQVGFVALRKYSERSVSIIRSRAELTDLNVSDSEPISDQHESVKIRGVLQFADATDGDSNIIKVIDNDDSHTIEVPEGMMNDIVRPMWDSNVIVKGIRYPKKVVLQEIDPDFDEQYPGLF